jgi:putative ubiquitin-RnfH superfamily antitoxin RatB of RatAB toxin-antitoxin module
MRVDLVYCPQAGVVHEWCLELAEGATLATALRLARERWPQGLAPWPEPVSAGVWGRRQAPDGVLREGDRVEVYRALRVDPKVARRERFQSQGARSTGLFARRRPGGKQGY